MNRVELVRNGFEVLCGEPATFEVYADRINMSSAATLRNTCEDLG